MSSPKSVGDYVNTYKEYELEQLRTMITQNASPEAVELSAQPWKFTRETLEDVNDRTRRALERLLAGWSGEAADEFRSRVERLSEFTADLVHYMRWVEAEMVPDLARHLKDAQDSAAAVDSEASEKSYEEWSESRESHEMNDRLNYENAQKQDRERMAQIVGTLAFRYADMADAFQSNPPPLPATGTPGEHANPPGGALFDDALTNAGGENGGAPPTPAEAGEFASESDEVEPDAPATPATDDSWNMGSSDDDEARGEGLYAGTGGAGLGGGASVGAPSGAPAGSAGVGAMGAGAAGLGVAGAGAAAASGGGAGPRGGAGNSPAARAAGPGGGQSAAGRPGAAAGRPGGAGMAGGAGRPGESSEEEAADDSNWLKESEQYFHHFDPNAGPSDEYDPKSVREWERMYDRWKEMQETSER